MSPDTRVLLLPRTSWASTRLALRLPRSNTELAADADCLSSLPLIAVAWPARDLEYLDDAGLNVTLADAPLGE
jgi:hypothetical protein